MKTLFIALAVAAGSVSLSACGSVSGEPDGGDEAIVASAPAQAAATSPIPESSASPLREQAPCTPDAFLPVVGQALDNGKLRIVEIQVKRCQEGYAQVFAVPDQSACEPGVGYCFEREQVFLGWDDTWRVLFSGTGISCEVPGFETAEQVAQACEKLGYAGY